jgi:uncharacterized protein with HEPN domain
LTDRNRRTREDWLRDIILWGERLARHIDGMTRERFAASELVQDGVIRCIEVIGEAAGQLMRSVPGLETAHPDLELRQAYAARVRIAHGYYSTDDDIVWSAATNSVPKTVESARALLREWEDEARKPSFDS